MVFWRPHTLTDHKKIGDFLLLFAWKIENSLRDAWELFSYSSQILVFVYLKKRDKCFIIKWLHDDALFGEKLCKCINIEWTIDGGFSVFLNENIG